MSRILKRPMFRIGGTPNQGIMNGLVDRKGYQQGTTWEETLEKYPNIKEAYGAIGGIDQPRDTSMYEMLIGGGLNLVGGGGSGEGLPANIVRSYKGPSEDYFKAQRARQAYDSDLKTTAAQAGLQQKWKMDLAKAKDNPQTALYNIYLKQAIENGYDAPEAQRIADYQTIHKTDLQNKVGRNRVAGVLDFDISDQGQLKKKLPKLRDKVGMYFYDPYDGKFKLLTSKNGILGFDQFNSVDEIVFSEPDAASPTIEADPTPDIFSPEYADAMA
jgi:hypothetical protein